LPTENREFILGLGVYPEQIYIGKIKILMDKTEISLMKGIALKITLSPLLNFGFVYYCFKNHRLKKNGKL